MFLVYFEKYSHQVNFYCKAHEKITNDVHLFIILLEIPKNASVFSRKEKAIGRLAPLSLICGSQCYQDHRECFQFEELNDFSWQLASFQMLYLLEHFKYFRIFKFTQNYFPTYNVQFLLRMVHNESLFI